MASMRNLAIALSVGLLGVTGCGGSNSGQIQLTWQVTQGGQPVACAAGESVRLTTGSFTDQFDCAAMSGVTGAIPVGNYSVVIDLVDSAGTVESTTTMDPVPVRGDAITDIGHIIFEIGGQPAPGSISFSWTIQTPSGPGACAPDGSEHFTIDLGGGTTFQADCPANSTGMNVSVPNVPVGTYTVTVSLVQGTTVESTTNPPFSGVTVASGQNTDLGAIVFAVNAIRQH